MSNIRSDIDHIQSYVSEHQLVELICDLVSIPSYPGIENQENAVAEYINNYFHKAGIESEMVPVIDGRSNVYARIKGAGGGRTLLFTGHMDTVPPYDMENACSPEIIERRIIGRGTSDMKGALACMMTAFKIIKDAEIKLPGDLIFVGVIDEELTSEGTRAFLRSDIIVDAAIVGEPMGLDLGIGHKGLQWFQFDVHGRSVHGGEQQNGINAIKYAAILIDRMEKELIPELGARIHPLIGSSTLNYGYINGGFQPSTVAGECVLQIDRRWIPGEKYDDVCREFEDLILGIKKDYPDFKCDFGVVENSEMEEGIIHEAFTTDLSETVVRAAEKAFFASTGKTLQKRAFPAWSDGGLISHYGNIPVIIMGPGDLSCAHTNREYLDIDMAVQFVQIYIKTAFYFLHWEDI